VLFFLGLDRGSDFLVSAARGAILAVWGMSVFILAFGYAAAWLPWPGALVAAILGYVATALITQGLAVPLVVAASVAAAALVGTNLALPHPKFTAPLLKPPAWDIPARMAATFLLVSGIMVSADLLGPQRSGLIASYPVILTVIGSFTQHQLGRDGLLRVLRGISLSLLAFTGFFFVIAFATSELGQTLAYVAATATALVISGLLVAWSQRPRSGRFIR
jgi:hypothetical protein